MLILESEPSCLNKPPKWMFGLQLWRNSHFGFVSCCSTWIIKLSWAINPGRSLSWAPSGPLQFRVLTRASRASGEKNLFPRKPSCKQMHFSGRKKDLSCRVWNANLSVSLSLRIWETQMSCAPVYVEVDLVLPKIFPNTFQSRKLDLCNWLKVPVGRKLSLENANLCSLKQDLQTWQL